MSDFSTPSDFHTHSDFPTPSDSTQSRASTSPSTSPTAASDDHGAAVPAEPAVTPVERPQCWECRRRRLVCDGTQPVCTKCRTARIVCPGYADKKPLTWLAPGQVMSRARRKKATGLRKPAANSSKKQQPKDPKPKPKPTKSTSPHLSDSGSEDPIDSRANELDHSQARLPVDLRPEVFDMFEAMLYFNGHIFPDLVKNQFGPSSYVVPLVVAEGVPAPIIHTLVSVVLSHRIIQLAEHPGSDQLVKPLWTRLYRHRDTAVAAINKRVGDEKLRSHLGTIVAVYTLLFAMLQQSFTPCWHTHINGFMSLMEPHGTFSELMKKCPEMELSLMALMIVSVLANTTSPHDNQHQVASTADTLRLAQTHYTETYFPSATYPPELFTELILINDLRTHDPSPETSHAAMLILTRIEAFSPEAWSSTKDEAIQPDWLLLSSVFHAATALFAILSLQSSGALPRSSPALGLSRARHARHLFAMLEDAMANRRVRKRMTWPLVVAGVEAARASSEVQRYIGERLVEMSKDQGSAPPLVAKGVLERFWFLGGGSWDDCFGEPLALVM